MDEPKQEAKPAAQQDRKVDPKFVAAHRRLVVAAMKVIYSSKEMVERLVGVVERGATPAEGLKNAIEIVVRVLQEKMSRVDPEFAYSVSKQAGVMIGQLASAAGVIEDKLEIVDEALSLMVKGPAQPKTREAEPAPEMRSAPADGEEEDEEDDEAAPPARGLLNEEMEA